MLKKTLPSLAMLLAICLGTHSSPLLGQEVNLDEVDIFGDTPQQPTAPAAPTDNGLPTDDVFGPPDQGEGGEPADDDRLEIASEEDLIKVMQRAQQLAADGDCNAAINIYSQLLQNRQLSGYAPALFERGRCLVKVGELQLALDAFDQAAQYGAPFGLAVPALVERGKVMLELGSPQDALDLFSQAVAANPVVAEYLFLRGKAQARVAQSSFGAPANAIQEAISSFDRAITLNPQYAEAFAERAGAYLATGELDKAIEDYDQSVQLNSEDSSVQARRGAAYQRRGDVEKSRPNPKLDEAVADYQAALKAYNEYLAMEKGKTAEDYEDASPEMILPDQVYLSRAGARIALANELKQELREPIYQQAIDDCQLALEFTPDMPGAYFHQGVAQRLLGRFDDAIESYTVLADMSPQFEPEAVLRRGIVFYYQGDVQSAQRDFERAAEFLVDGRASFWLGVTHARLGDQLEAHRHYTQAIRENPLYLPAYSNRGLVNMQLGLYDRAFDDFDFLVRRNADDEVARERREAARRLLAEQRRNPYQFAYER